MMRASFFLLHALLITALTANAQFGHLEGTITDQKRNPIVGATVKLPDLQRGAVTRSDGTFSVRNIPAGRHRIEVSAIGYDRYLATITVSAGKTEQLRIVLRQESIEAQAVEVTATRRLQEQTDTRTSVLTVDPPRGQIQSRRHRRCLSHAAESPRRNSTERFFLPTYRPRLRT